MNRQHSIFRIEFTKETRDRIEDNCGELMGYSKPYNTKMTRNVIAPSFEIAKAWIEWKCKGSDIALVQEMKIDAIVEEHAL